jgi:hypothetical protein
LRSAVKFDDARQGVADDHVSVYSKENIIKNVILRLALYSRPEIEKEHRYEYGNMDGQYTDEDFVHTLAIKSQRLSCW